MKFTHEQFMSFIVGAVEIERVPDGWKPHRMPKAMRPIYEATDGARIRMECPACIRIRFVSDTKAVRISMRFGAEARQIYNGSALVDKKLKAMFGPAVRQETWEGVIFGQARRKKHVFDIWLPHLVRSDLISIEVDDDCTLEVAPPLKLKWLVYGDSVTQGMTCTQPAISNIARCALALDAEAHNLAIGGATADYRLAETVPEIEWAVVSIAYGSNDWNQSLPVAGYVDNTRRLIEALQRKRPGKPVALITPVTYAGGPPPNKLGLSLDDYRKALTEMAVKRPGVFLMQGNKLVPDDEKWFVDKVHPNDAGMELYAKNLLPVLKEALSYKPQ